MKEGLEADHVKMHREETRNMREGMEADHEKRVVLVIRGKLYLLVPFRVLVVWVDIGARLVSERYSRYTNYIYI